MHRVCLYEQPSYCYNISTEMGVCVVVSMRSVARKPMLRFKRVNRVKETRVNVQYKLDRKSIRRYAY